MVIWYKNSILASFISIFGCAFVILGITEGGGIAAVAIGIVMVILGKLISDRKAKKKLEKIQKEKGIGNTANGSRNTGNTAHGYGPQNGGAAGYGNQSAGNSAYGYGPQNGGAAGYGNQNAGNAAYGYGPQNGGAAGYGNQNTGNAGYTSQNNFSGQFANGTAANDHMNWTNQQKEKTTQEIIDEAQTYAEKGDYQKELETLLSGLPKAPNHAQLLNHIGRAYRHKGDYKTALDYYYRSALINPNDIAIGTNIATAYMFLGEYDQSKKYFEGEIARLEKMNDPVVRSTLGITYANYAQCVGKMGDLNRARDYLYKAKQVGYEHTEEAWKMLFGG